MKTPAEIVVELKRIANGEVSDFFGSRAGDLVEHLEFEQAREFLKPEGTAEEWKAKPLTREGVEAEMREYLSFAWDKANNCRGLSASRSMDHFSTWLWMIGDPELTSGFDAIEYEHYGKEKLIYISEKVGFDWKEVDDNIRTNGEE